MKKLLFGILTLTVIALGLNFVSCSDRSSFADLNPCADGSCQLPDPEPIFIPPQPDPDPDPVIEEKKLVCFDFGTTIDVDIDALENVRLSRDSLENVNFNTDTLDDTVRINVIDSQLPADYTSTDPVADVDVPPFEIQPSGDEETDDDNFMFNVWLDADSMNRVITAVNGLLNNQCIEERLETVRSEAEFSRFDLVGKDLFVHDSEEAIENLSEYEIVRVKTDFCEALTLDSGCYILDKVEETDGI